MKLRYILYMFLILFVFSGCNKDDHYRMDDFFLDFATVNNSSGKTNFVLDSYRTLVPNVDLSKLWSEGQRVGINYTFINGDTIKINSLSEIHTSNIKDKLGIDDISADPIKIESVWVGGDHLNMIFYVEYFDKSHKIDLLRDIESDSDEISLHINYSRNNDSPGYTKKMHASFNLKSIQSESGEITPFKLYINTYTGLRVFDLKVSASR